MGNWEISKELGVPEEVESGDAPGIFNGLTWRNQCW